MTTPFDLDALLLRIDQVGVDEVATIQAEFVAYMQTLSPDQQDLVNQGFAARIRQRMAFTATKLDRPERNVVRV